MPASIKLYFKQVIKQCRINVPQSILHGKVPGVDDEKNYVRISFNRLLFVLSQSLINLCLKKRHQDIFVIQYMFIP